MTWMPPKKYFFQRIRISAERSGLCVLMKKRCVHILGTNHHSKWDRFQLILNTVTVTMVKDCQQKQA